MAKEKTPVSPVYGYLRQWFNFAFEHQGEVTGNHTAVYCWFIEQNNRLGWAKEFGAPRDQTMAAAGISSYNTYKNCFNDLVSWGFVRVVKKSKNQYVAHIIALSKFDKALYKALDKALIEHCTEHCHSTVHGTVALTIPLNNYTTIPLNNIVVVEYACAKDFFLSSRNFRVLKDLNHLDDFQMENFFKRYYDEKIDIGELNNKTESDMVKHFSMWLPKIILSEKNNKNGNKLEKPRLEVIGNTITTELQQKYGDEWRKHIPAG